jgi:hypothetical protein
MKSKPRPVTLLLVFLLTPVLCQPQTSPDPRNTGSAGNLSLEELSKQISNPLSRIWSLAFQNDFDALTSDLIQTREGHINVATFQPVLPMPVGDQWTFFARPVLPLISIPRLNDSPPPFFDGHTTGMGDMIIATGIGKRELEVPRGDWEEPLSFPRQADHFLEMDRGKRVLRP